MSDQSNPGLGDLFSLFGGPNPFSAIGKSVEQFRRGVNEFAKGIENFNATMENLNAIAARINGLLDEVEEPIRAFVPQVTRSIKAADAVITQITGPIDRVTPGINRLAETLSSPVFNRMPNDIGAFLDALGDISQRMQPLSQMAETAGGLFGLRSLSSALRGATPARTVERAPSSPAASTATAPTATKAAATRPAAKKTGTRKTAAKKNPAKKTAARKTTAKRASTKKAATKRSR